MNANHRLLKRSKRAAANDRIQTGGTRFLVCFGTAALLVLWGLSIILRKSMDEVTTLGQINSPPPFYFPSQRDEKQTGDLVTIRLASSDRGEQNVGEEGNGDKLTDTGSVIQKFQVENEQKERKETGTQQTQKQKSTTNNRVKSSSIMAASISANRDGRTFNTAQNKKAAFEFVEQRRQVYLQQNRTQTWQWRGNGYLLQRHQMILMAQKDNKKRNAIRIQDVYMPNRKNCQQFTIWVRVNGPEIFAGKANAVHNEHSPSSCHWEFQYDLRVSGTYRLDARILMWDSGQTQVRTCEGESMNTTESSNFPKIPNSILQKYPIHSGFLAFKLYHPPRMCCEICSRIPSCRYWATPPLSIPIKGLSRAHNGCELFFPAGASLHDIPYSNILPNHGRPVTNTTVANLVYTGRSKRIDGYKYGPPVHQYFETSYYIGCGWSYWFSADYPCLSGELDDQIYTPAPVLQLDMDQNKSSIPEVTIATTTRIELKDAVGTAGSSTDYKKNDNSLPLCTLQDEHMAQGRWVREPFHSQASDGNATCPLPFQLEQTKRKFRVTAVDPHHPHCWHRDDLTNIGKIKLEIRHLPLLSRQSRWISTVQRETEFMAVWRNDRCDYLEFTNAQLQDCITKRKIKAITTRGKSIAEHLLEYINIRLDGIELWNATAVAATAATGKHHEDEGVAVILDTLKLAHYAWGPTQDLIEDMQEYPFVNETLEYYWVTGYFISSERELHCHAEKMIEFGKILPSILEPKGYRMIEAFNMSAAFAYDVAAQFDGLHFVGPPPKMVVTKLFHHMCASTVEGSRL